MIATAIIPCQRKLGNVGYAIANSFDFCRLITLHFFKELWMNFATNVRYSCAAGCAQLRCFCRFAVARVRLAAEDQPNRTRSCPEAVPNQSRTTAEAQPNSSRSRVEQHPKQSRTTPEGLPKDPGKVATVQSDQRSSKSTINVWSSVCALCC